MTISPAVSMGQLVIRASEAIQGAQRKLDEQLVHAPAIAYAIPRVTVNSSYQISTVQGKTLHLFGDKKEEKDSYSVGFTLELAQEPMPQLTSLSMPPVSLSVPPFIEHQTVVAQLVRDLCASLEVMDADLFEDEIEKLKDAASNQDDDPGLVAFRLDEAETYLIARIGGRRDGIFLFDRSATPKATVFSHWDSKGKTLPWAPFAKLFEAMRVWQRTGTSRQISEAAPERIGGIEPQEFLEAMWNAYIEARGFLTSADGDSLPAVPAYYLLDQMRALLSYSVPREAGKKSDDDAPLIKSDLAVSVRKEGGASSIEMKLRAPEYVLVDEQKKAALELLLHNLDLDADDDDGLLSIISPALQSNYETALRDAARAADALVLLSYEDKPPKNEFLFVWRGSIGAEEREFAFRMKLDDGKLVDPEMVRRLEDSEQTEVQYHKDAAGLHDFFHAVWIWTIMGGWFPA